MKLNKAGIDFIKGHESLRLTAYRPTSNDRWTIGWGNTFYLNGSPVKQGDTITKTEAEKLFLGSLIPFERSVQDSIKIPINQSQFNSLVSLSYNIGVDRFKQSSVVKLINNNGSKNDIANAFLKWTKQKGKILEGLINRRKSEIQQYFNGKSSTMQQNILPTILPFLIVGAIIYLIKK